MTPQLIHLFLLSVIQVFTLKQKAKIMIILFIESNKIIESGKDSL